MSENEAEKKPELKFPLKFDVCPNCGSPERIAGTILEEERDKGRVITKGLLGSVAVLTTAIFDPMFPALQAPVTRAYIDICSKCGTLYCYYAEKQTMRPETNIPGTGPKPKYPFISG